MRAVQASIAVVVITLVLFFASGMYEEKIRYAHACVLSLPFLLTMASFDAQETKPPGTSTTRTKRSDR